MIWSTYTVSSTCGLEKVRTNLLEKELVAGAPSRYPIHRSDHLEIHSRLTCHHWRNTLASDNWHPGPHDTCTSGRRVDSPACRDLVHPASYEGGGIENWEIDLMTCWCSNINAQIKNVEIYKHVHVWIGMARGDDPK